MREEDLLLETHCIISFPRWPWSGEVFGAEHIDDDFLSALFQALSPKPWSRVYTQRFIFRDAQDQYRISVLCEDFVLTTFDRQRSILSSWVVHFVRDPLVDVV